MNEEHTDPCRIFLERGDGPGIAHRIAHELHSELPRELHADDEASRDIVMYAAKGVFTHYHGPKTKQRDPEQKDNPWYIIYDWIYPLGFIYKGENGFKQAVRKLNLFLCKLIESLPIDNYLKDKKLEDIDIIYDEYGIHGNGGEIIKFSQVYQKYLDHSREKNNKYIEEKTKAEDEKTGKENEAFAFNFHPKLGGAIRLYKKEEYVSAVQKAVKLYEMEVRSKADDPVDENGKNYNISELMKTVFDHEPKTKTLLSAKFAEKGIEEVDKFSNYLIFNPEKNKKHMTSFSMKLLSRGLITGIRNPAMHKNAVYTKEDCLEILALTSYLLRNLDAMQLKNLKSEENDLPF